jgi:hypothetical protein
LLVSRVLTLDDIAAQGDVLAIYLWFAVLFTLSSQLNALGFMGFIGQKLALALGGVPPAAAAVVLLVSYVALHYLFVSQTAHLLAVFGVFLDVGARLGVAPGILAYQMLFATNYFSVITPQGSSANLLFAGSGYMTQGEMYRIGAICTTRQSCRVRRGWRAVAVAGNSLGGFYGQTSHRLHAADRGSGRGARQHANIAAHRSSCSRPAAPSPARPGVTCRPPTSRGRSGSISSSPRCRRRRSWRTCAASRSRTSARRT